MPPGSTHIDISLRKVFDFLIENKTLLGFEYICDNFIKAFESLND